MSQDAFSVHAADTSQSPFAANQDLEERQASSQVAMISSKHEVMSRDTPSVHATDTSPFAANQDPEERQAPLHWHAAMISSNHDLRILNGTFYHVLGSVHHNSSHNRSGQ